jgi:hypothetical protein
VVALSILGSGFLGHQLGVAPSRPPALPRLLTIESPYDVQGRWFKGNLHVASVRGVGRELPSAVGQWYAAHGFSFLGLSDMNTFTWTSEYANHTLVGVPTVDARYPFGDLLAVGMDHWLPAGSLQEAINWIAGDGGLPILAASQSPGKPIPSQTFNRLVRLYGVEVYNARLASAGAGDATAVWDAMLSAGNRVYAFAGDDATSLADAGVGHAWIEVMAADADLDSLLGSLRRGSFFASSGASFNRFHVSGRRIQVEATPGTSLRFIGRGGRLLKAVSAPSGSYDVTGSEGYVRVEAVGDDGGRAWSQPFFLSWR